MTGQSFILLPDCGVSYIDPQNASSHPSTNKDTLVYRQYFPADSVLRSYSVDINAFGGQQPDRVSVFAILPDSSLKTLGRMAFGKCADCVDGFALVYNDSLWVEGENDKAVMDLWLQSLGQPGFALGNNLQTLAGVGRISGEIPFCAIGIFMEFVISSSSVNSTTEFSTHIFCLTEGPKCSVEKKVLVDCAKDSLFLEAVFPEPCWSASAQVSWITPQGRVTTGKTVALPLSGNQGKHFLRIEDDCCTYFDSVWIDNALFLSAGPDTSVCPGETLSLAGTGGFGHHWEDPRGIAHQDSILKLQDVNKGHSGRYVLFGSNENGCLASDTMELKVYIPEEPLTDIQPPCIGDSVLLGLQNPAAFKNITWVHPDGHEITNPILSNFSASDAGDYTLIALDTNGCNSQKTLTLQSGSLPELTFDIVESCDSQRIVMSPPTYSYVWNTGQLGPYLATASAGSFQVTVTGATGCVVTQVIEVPEPDGPGVNLVVTHPKCPNDFGTIDIEPDDPGRPLIYSIDGGESYHLSGTFDKLIPGKYFLSIQDDLGCMVNQQAEIMAPDTLGVSLDSTEIRVKPNTHIKLRATVIGSYNLIQWVPEQIDSGEPEVSFVASHNLDIRVIVEDQRGCKASTALPLSIVLGEAYAPNAFSPNGDGVNDRFTLYSDTSSGEIIEQISIYDRWGNTLFAGRELPLSEEGAGWDGKVRGRIMPPGPVAYFGVIRYPNGARRQLQGVVNLIK